LIDWILPLMVNPSAFEDENEQTAFTVSIDAARLEVSTGISAEDRARTIQVAINPSARPSDLHRPGHIFPLPASLTRVLKRAGHTEAGVDLATLAGLYPPGLISNSKSRWLPAWPAYRSWSPTPAVWLEADQHCRPDQLSPGA
jgi:3,4-dihydroxy-2-butanone 4-phosphate synthase